MSTGRGDSAEWFGSLVSAAGFRVLKGRAFGFAGSSQEHPQERRLRTGPATALSRQPAVALPATLFLLALLCASPERVAYAGVNVWTSNGPEGGEVYALAIDPTTPSTLYAGLEEGVFIEPCRSNRKPDATEALEKAAHNTATFLFLSQRSIRARMRARAGAR